jgi:hypothetical protein
MSMHHHTPNQAVLAASWMLFRPGCSHKMRIIMAAPAQNGTVTRTYERLRAPGMDDRCPSLMGRPRQLMTACSDWPYGKRMLSQHCFSLPLRSLGNSIALIAQCNPVKKSPGLNRGIRTSWSCNT